MLFCWVYIVARMEHVIRRFEGSGEKGSYFIDLWQSNLGIFEYTCRFRGATWQRSEDG